MWPWYNASFVPPASATTLLGNLLLLPLEFCFPSSLAAVGMEWHLYLDTANSLLGDQNQPLIPGRVEVAFPLLGPHRQKAHRVPPLQDPAQRPQ